MICNGTKHPESLQVSKNQSQTREMNSGGYKEEMSLSQLASKIVFKCPKISRKQAK
jgi:hypothetical protein